MLKSKTREFAKELGLNVADKPDSQDICFVPNGDYVSIIEKIRPDAFRKGNIKNTEGKVLGVHDGIVNFTIGQRRGIKIKIKENPLYVIDLDPKKNEIIVGNKKKLLKKIILKDLNLLVDKSEFEKEIFVKVRSTGRLIKSKLNIINNHN